MPMGNGKKRLQYRKTKVEINEKMHGCVFFRIWFFFSISPVPFLVCRIPVLCSLLACREPNNVSNFTWTKKSVWVKTLSSNFYFLWYVPFAILKIIIDIIVMQIKVTVVVVVFVFYVSREIYSLGLKILQKDEIKGNDSVLFWLRGTQRLFSMKYENIL